MSAGNPRWPSNASPGLGRAIREARGKAGFTLRRFAEMVGVSAPYVCDVEHGRRGISDLDAWAKLLNVDPRKLEAECDRLTREELAWIHARPEVMHLLREMRSRPPRRRSHEPDRSRAARKRKEGCE